MYFVALLKNGKIVDFDKKCVSYSVADDGFTSFYAENRNAIGAISTSYISAIVSSDYIKIFENLLPNLNP